MKMNMVSIVTMTIVLSSISGCTGKDFSLSGVMDDVRAYNKQNPNVYGKNTTPYKGVATLECRTGTRKYTLSLQPRAEKKMLIKVYEGEGWDGPVIGEREIYYDPKTGLPDRRVPYGTRGSIKAQFVSLPDGKKGLGGEFYDKKRCAGEKGTALLVPYTDTRYTTLGQ